MKVHIVTAGNRSAYIPHLREMHRRRHETFVTKLGWNLQSENGLEIDEYDDEHAVYLLSIKNDELHGSMRLLPAWRRSLCADHLAQFISRPCEPRAVDTWEWTRWLPGILERRRDFVRSRQSLFLAALEFAASRGVARYTAVCSPRSVGELEELDWSPRPLGLPQSYSDGGEDSVAMAVEWAVTPDMLPQTRELFRWSGSAAFEVVAADPQAPAPSLLERVASLRTPDAIAALQNFLDGWQVRPAAQLEHLQLVASQGRA